MNCRCISVNSQIEHEFPTHLINPQAILIEDINQDNVKEILKIIKFKILKCKFI